MIKKLLSKKLKYYYKNSQFCILKTFLQWDYLGEKDVAGIDPLAISDIKNLIVHLRDRNIGILITDHNVRDTLDIVDRAYVIYDGKVLLEGTPSEIAANNQKKVTMYKEMAERFKAHAWKACSRATVSGVRIPFSPPFYMGLLNI
ncbi:unnamed protein product [Oppiella nova]|uniref:Uncharacterized protein n=1 Tax=Oppiella nova TaxID=334625 RepID=A0A7R9LD25_9ACAR|nr:unnamed protein product [Oppiella nova]CAG2161601.1 unnamed protein product [Oppiella nova]